MVNIPGAAISDQIIRRECRDGRGADGAFDEAVSRLRITYNELIGKGVSDDTDLHIALIVQQDRHRSAAKQAKLDDDNQAAAERETIRDLREQLAAAKIAQ